MLYLARHDGTLHAFRFKGFNQLGKLAERKPVDRGSSATLDFGRSLLFNRSDHNVKALGPGRFQNQEGELAVACDQAEFLFGRIHGKN